MIWNKYSKYWNKYSKYLIKFVCHWLGNIYPTLHHLTIYRTTTALTEKKNVMILKLKFLISEKLNTGESSEFVVVPFLGICGWPLPMNLHTRRRLIKKDLIFLL